jgi:hypothetical protein
MKLIILVFSVFFGRDKNIEQVEGPLSEVLGARNT